MAHVYMYPCASALVVLEPPAASRPFAPKPSNTRLESEMENRARNLKLNRNGGVGAMQTPEASFFTDVPVTDCSHCFLYFEVKIISHVAVTGVCPHLRLGSGFRCGYISRTGNSCCGVGYGWVGLAKVTSKAPKEIWNQPLQNAWKSC